MNRIFTNYSHSVMANDDGTYEVCFGDDDVFVADGFTTAEGAIAFANIHEFAA